MPLRIDTGEILAGQVIDALNRAIAKRSQYFVVINMSWHMTAPDAGLNAKLADALDEGCVLVAAAGNTTGNVNYPANHSDVFAVGQTNACDEWQGDDNACEPFAGESATGSNLDVVAPGSGIVTTKSPLIGTSSKYDSVDGTSFASPLTAGIAALILSVDDGLEPSEVYEIIRDSAEDLVGQSSKDTPGRDNYMGDGRVNAYRAVQLAAGYPLVDVGRRSLADAGNGLAAAWGDYDNDGKEDLYLVNSGSADRLLRNVNDAAVKFTDVTSSPLGDTGYGTAAAWADYDNDGDLDLYLVKNEAANKLYRNNGGSFTEITPSPLGDTGPATAFAWLDYDLDGFVDIYLVNHNSANKLFRNTGCGSFTDVTASPLGDTGPGLGVACADYDGDGDTDIYLVNDGAGNKLFRNDGSSFTDVTQSPLAGTTYGQSAAWSDYDNDRDVDLLLISRGGNRLYRNNGGGSFTDVTGGPIDADDNVRGGVWFDYDNDVDLDIYVSRDGAAGNSLLRNDGSGTFVDITEGPLGSTLSGRGVAVTDYNRDGATDLYLVNYGGANQLFRNYAAGAFHWLHVRLVGVDTNRSAIGATVRVVEGATSQVRHVSGDAGFASQGSLLLEFGVGTTTNIDTVEVRWPGVGVQTLTGVAADQVITVTECPAGTPSIIEASMVAWAESNPTPNYMTLHFGFEATRIADQFEIQYRPVGGSWTTLTCTSPGTDCTFACDRSYERTTSYSPCEVTQFEWRAKAKNCNGWASSYSSIKTFTAYCLE
jgi:hypothetical protein